MRLREYTERRSREAVKNSTSLAQTLKELGVAPSGGNYHVSSRAIAHLNLDTSHFTGQLWNKGRTTGPKQPLRRYSSNELQIRSGQLKSRLLSEGVSTRRRARCRNIEWPGQPVPLELDHIYGDHPDNRLLNPRLLRPNRHALTPTYRGKNRAPELSSVSPSA